MKKISIILFTIFILGSCKTSQVNISSGIAGSTVILASDTLYLSTTVFVKSNLKQVIENFARTKSLHTQNISIDFLQLGLDSTAIHISTWLPVQTK